MDMIYCVIIGRNSLVRVIQTFTYEIRDYKFFPDSNGEPITFEDKDACIQWLQANIKAELIDPECNIFKNILIRQKYLINSRPIEIEFPEIYKSF